MKDRPTCSRKSRFALGTNVNVSLMNRAEPWVSPGREGNLGPLLSTRTPDEANAAPGQEGLWLWAEANANPLEEAILNFGPLDSQGLR